MSQDEVTVDDHMDIYLEENKEHRGIIIIRSGYESNSVRKTNKQKKQKNYE